MTTTTPETKSNLDYDFDRDTLKPRDVVWAPCYFKDNVADVYVENESGRRNERPFVVEGVDGDTVYLRSISSNEFTMQDDDNKPINTSTPITKLSSTGLDHDSYIHCHKNAVCEFEKSEITAKSGRLHVSDFNKALRHVDDCKHLEPTKALKSPSVVQNEIEVEPKPIVRRPPRRRTIQNTTQRNGRGNDREHEAFTR